MSHGVVLLWRTGLGVSTKNNRTNSALYFLACGMAIGVSAYSSSRDGRGASRDTSRGANHGARGDGLALGYHGHDASQRGPESRSCGGLPSGRAGYPGGPDVSHAYYDGHRGAYAKRSGPPLRRPIMSSSRAHR